MIKFDSQNMQCNCGEEGRLGERLDGGGKDSRRREGGNTNAKCLTPQITPIRNPLLLLYSKASSALLRTRRRTFLRYAGLQREKEKRVSARFFSILEIRKQIRTFKISSDLLGGIDICWAVEVWLVG